MALPLPLPVLVEVAVLGGAEVVEPGGEGVFGVGVLYGDHFGAVFWAEI